MTLDPFATVDESTQRTELPVDVYPKGIFHGMDGAQLVSDGANAADTGRDIGSFAIHATAQKCLEEAWWLEDFKLYIRDFVAANLDIECSFAFDAGQVIYLDGLSVHALHSPCGMRRHRRCSCGTPVECPGCSCRADPCPRSTRRYWAFLSGHSSHSSHAHRPGRWRRTRRG